MSEAVTFDRARWPRLGAVPPRELTDTRVALHQAVQLLASFGGTLVSPRSDDSHRNLGWDMSRRGFVTHRSRDGLTVELAVADFTLELRDPTGLLAATELHGWTLDEARSWLGEALGEVRESDPVALEWPEYDVPDLPEGVTTLVPEAEALDELARWYTGAALVLDAIHDRSPEASPVRCWPHHFDIATLLTLPATSAAGEPSSVGVGMSPGDDSQPGPYFYVNGWPHPDPTTLPRLDGAGHWNTEGWVGAVLPAAAVVSAPRPSEQAVRVDAFITEAVEAMRAVVLVARGSA